MLSVCSDVPRAPSDRCGLGPLVWGKDGRLAPNVGTNSPGWYSVYDDTKASPTLSKAFSGDYVAQLVLRDIACDYVGSGCPLPPNLRTFALGVLMQSASLLLSPGLTLTKTIHVTSG